MKISTIILVKNEEENIDKCVKSASFSDEIIVVDDFSTDKTKNKLALIKKLLKETQIQVFQRALAGDFATQRNFGMQKAKNEWVLFLDADEVISDELKREIINLKPGKTSYYIKRRDFFWGRELRYGETRKARSKGLIRLIKNKSGKWQGMVHEEFIPVEIPGKLKSYLNHYPHQTVKEFINEINYYSSLRADELNRQGKRFSIFEAVFLPLLKFKLNYFVYLGFLDGAAGFVYAFLMSFHSFLVRAKLFQLRFEHEKR